MSKSRVGKMQGIEGGLVYQTVSGSTLNTNEGCARWELVRSEERRSLRSRPGVDVEQVRCNARCICVFVAAVRDGG
jgi:hypothetical protein